MCPGDLPPRRADTDQRRGENVSEHVTRDLRVRVDVVDERAVLGRRSRSGGTAPTRPASAQKAVAADALRGAAAASSLLCVTRRAGPLIHKWSQRMYGTVPDRWPIGADFDACRPAVVATAAESRPSGRAGPSECD